MLEPEPLRENDVRTYGATRSMTVLDRTKELRSFRPFMKDQFRRRLRIKYSRSLLGWAWSLINPISILLIYTLVFGTILQGRRQIVPNPDGLDSFGHYLFSAMVVWFIFNQVSTTALSSFTQALGLRKRLYFPPAAPILAAVLAGLVTNGVEVLVLVGAYLVVGSIALSFFGLLLVLPLTALFGLGVGMFLAPLNARFRDVGHLYSVLLRLLFFVTPIIYSINIVPESYGGLPMRELLYLNPLTWMTESSRDLVFHQQWPHWYAWVVMTGCSLFSFIAGWVVFHRLADEVVEGF